MPFAYFDVLITNHTHKTDVCISSVIGHSPISHPPAFPLSHHFIRCNSKGIGNVNDEAFSGRSERFEFWTGKWKHLKHFSYCALGSTLAGQSAVTVLL